ncbi:uncharacterized protein LOC135707755 [Ochlerotatus camptorhynchus]|uniref:uncharacterized protein LOC135707755 n=1 Tax=Ochlerotatus camptorhynchus TaxID=644619 RepID=UPI0031E4743E
MARNIETMAETYIRLKAEARRIGLAINASKTKCMKGRGSREDNVSLPPRVQIDGNEIEMVDEFVYLGSLVTAENDTSREIQRRIMAGNRVYFVLRRTLRSNKIRCRMHLTVYKTLIRPVILYGYETWTMLVEDQRALGVFEQNVRPNRNKKKRRATGKVDRPSRRPTAEPSQTTRLAKCGHGSSRVETTSSDSRWQQGLSLIGKGSSERNSC